MMNNRFHKKSWPLRVVGIYRLSMLKISLDVESSWAYIISSFIHAVPNNLKIHELVPEITKTRKIIFLTSKCKTQISIHLNTKKKWTWIQNYKQLIIFLLEHEYMLELTKSYQKIKVKRYQSMVPKKWPKSRFSYGSQKRPWSKI